MKIRNGFVSNSSSSSFVVLLPKNFDAKDFVDKNINKLDSYIAEDILDNFEYEGDDEDGFVKEKTIEIINKFIKHKSVYQYDDGCDMSVIESLLEDYVIASMDVSSDSGCGVLLNTDKVEKILKS